MKPNKKQKAVAHVIESAAWSWFFTNDISSPTHLSDLDNALERLVEDSKVDPSIVAQIKYNARSIIIAIQNIEA